MKTTKNRKNHFPRALGRPAAPSLSDESVLFACGETMLKRLPAVGRLS